MYSMLLVQDETFRTLNIPISPEDRKEMDRKIKKGDAVPPVLYWKGRILTGYEQNEIALKYHRYYITSKEMFFPRKSDAVAWLCHEQLKRNDLVWPAKAWLIFKLHEALRDIAGREAAKEDFQYRQFSPSSQSNAESLEADRENVSVLRKLGNEFNYNKETIRRYVRFGRQLDKLEEMVPGARIKNPDGQPGDHHVPYARPDANAEGPAGEDDQRQAHKAPAPSPGILCPEPAYPNHPAKERFQIRTRHQTDAEVRP